MSRSRRARPSGSDYQVGYGRPPVAGQFKPGQSGNPKGRPRAAPDLRDILSRALATRVPVTENGRRRTITMVEAVIRGVVADAARRDAKAVRMLITLHTMLMPRTEPTPEAAFSTAEDEAILADFLARAGGVGTQASLTPADVGEAADLKPESDAAAATPDPST